MRTQYNIGDIVKILHNDYPDQFTTGGHYTIASVDADMDIYLKGSTGYEYLFLNDKVELASRAVPERLFKKGDRVRTTYNMSGLPRGTIGTIYDADEMDIIFDDWSGGHDGEANDGSTNHWYVSFDMIEKVEEAPALRPFKKGDRVRTKTRDDLVEAGSVGTVYAGEERDDDPWIDVIFDGFTEGHGGDANDGSKNHWYIGADNLELVDEPTSEPSLMDDLGGDFEGDFRVPFTDKMWIVAILDSEGKPRPNNKARVYTSSLQARRVSREMAERHKGEIFVVFEAVGVATHPRTPVLYVDL
jgi:hypothetical protein